MHKSSIIVNNLKIKMQGNYILDGITFSVLPTEHLTIVGDAGSGKTLLAKAIAGKIFFEGTIETGDARKIVLVDQHYHFKNLSNTNNFYYQQRYNSSDSDDALTVYNELLQVSTDEILIDDLLCNFQLNYRKHSPLLHLSSGEHKRFQLIKAFLTKPDILILDNPYAGLDVTSRKSLSVIFKQLAATQTRLIIITQPNEIPDCITHVLHLENGSAKYVETVLFLSRYTSHTNNNNCFNNLPKGNKIKNDFSVAVEMKNVSVKYHSKLILNNINWKVNRGDKWLIKGPNGAGKSTLLSLITGDNPQAYSNNITLFDKKRGTGESIWDIKKNIGYVSPELHWYFETNITCFQVIGSGFFDTIGLYKKLNVDQQNKIHEWLFYFNISHLAEELLSSVSAGNQRLILLARALIKNPSLLIFDEPCQGLDDHQKSTFIQLIDEICGHSDTTFIYVSHYNDEIPGCVNNILDLGDNKKEKLNNIHNRTAIAV